MNGTSGTGEWVGMGSRAMHSGAVQMQQCSAVQCSAVQCGAVRCSSVHMQMQIHSNTQRCVMDLSMRDGYIKAVHLELCHHLNTVLKPILGCVFCQRVSAGQHGFVFNDVVASTFGPDSHSTGHGQHRNLESDHSLAAQPAVSEPVPVPGSLSNVGTVIFRVTANKYS